MKATADWPAEAKQLIRAALKRGNLSYADLANRMETIGLRVKLRKPMLNHSHKQESAQGSTDQRTKKAEYDDRQSMLPFVQEEQRFEAPTHHDATKRENQETTDQRSLVGRTKILAIVTGALAFATSIVTGVSVWSARDTARLA